MFIAILRTHPKYSVSIRKSTTEYHLKDFRYIQMVILGYERYSAIFTGNVFNLFYVMETTNQGVIYDKQSHSFEYRIDFP